MPHASDRNVPQRNQGLSRWPSQLDDASAAVLIEAIEAVSRELRRTVPPQRGAPFFALEYPPGDLAPLDVLCSQGIFRKYEHALHIGAGLGAPARWWATHFGCSVLGVECVPTLAGAAAQLTRRAGLAAQVGFLAADACALPLRERFFTHVWAGDAIRTVPNPAAALREAWRVLRPGAHFAVRVAIDATAGPSADEWCARVAAAGFVEVTSRRAIPPQVNQVVQLARRRLDRVLRAGPDPIGVQLAVAYGAACEFATNEQAIAIVFARRPA